ncbi:MAG: PQQ-binding-like beta-propeller repeat protein [Verrucomicrobiota bacterium]
MMKRLVFGMIGFGVMAGLAGADEWVRFRGPNGSGVNEGALIPAEWNKSDYKWSVDLPGVGHGAPVIWEDRIFVLCGDDEKGTRMPVCLDAETGKVLWSEEFTPGNSKRHRYNSVAATTPAVDEERVYFSWGDKESLILMAFTHGGDEVWEADLGSVSGGHGFGASPVVYGDLLVLNNDQEGEENGFLVALDRETGEEAWRVDRESKRISYSTPVVYELGDEKGEVLVFTNWTHGFTAVDPTSGEVVAEKSVFYQETNERAISSPIAYNDLVLGTCGFTKNPKHAVAMKLDAGGDFEEVWRIERSVPHIPSPIFVNDLVFLWDDGGIVTCVEPATGNVKWRERVEAKGEVYGSPVSDGEKIFSVDKEGVVSVIAADDEFEVLAQNDLGELCRSTPAIADGVLYIRTHGKLHAIQGQKG